MTINIYRASAGSGKTYRLTEDYLKLVIQNPEKYKRVLAITFTNKATEEMKSRILLELFKLSSNQKSTYLTTLLEFNPNLTETTLRARSKEVLKNILYNYNHFDISTIDSFFQKIIKNFSKELGIKLGYNIELDNSQILEKAADLMMQDIGKNDDLTKWLVNFTQERIEKGYSWQIKNNVQQFGKELFKENFQQFSTQAKQKFADKAYLTKFQNQLNQLINEFENHLSKIGEQAIQIIDNQGLKEEDFKGKRNSIYPYFLRLKQKQRFDPTNTHRTFLDDFDNWFLKTAAKDKIEAMKSAYDNGVNRFLRSAFEYYDQNEIMYLSAMTVKKYFNDLGILSDLSAKISDIREEENILLISDINQLLNKIIDENDTPFIYEKTGNRYQHFLIDEFQDTSNYQWANLKPLLANSLDENNFNLIVGDAKQSIYRWRNGDWKLLNQNIYKNFSPSMINTEILESNFRSEENIIKFNNSIFKAVSRSLAKVFDEDQQKLIENIYSDSQQKIPDNKLNNKGFVKINFIEQEKAGNYYKQEVLNNLPVQIDELLNNGFQQKDICILVRKAKDGNEIAKILFESGKYNVVSKDSLFLKNSPSVRIIISAFKFLIKPDDNINTRHLFSELNRLKDNSKDYLEEGMLKQLKNLNQLGLLELTEKLICLFELNENLYEHAYLLAFQDSILEFQKGNPSDLGLFLDFWQEKNSEKSIQIPANTDAIQIMTIHKSKGLDFNIVLLPFFDWNLDHKLEVILWCKTHITPFNQFELLPIRYSANLQKTIFEDDYNDEKLSCYIDNINLMYVAFTRAKQGLIISGPLPKTDKITTISDLLFTSLNAKHDNTDLTIDLNLFTNQGNHSFSIGNIINSEKTEDDKFKTIDLKNLISNSNQPNLKIRYEASDIFNPKDHTQLNYGKFMHDVLSKIFTFNDIDTEIEKLHLNGTLNQPESNLLKQKIKELLSEEPFKDWFSGRWKIKNESPLLKPGNIMDIPDRIMILEDQAIVVDFKFGQPHNSHKNQVRDYKKDLIEMGFDTKAFLMYFENNQLEEVK